MSTDIKALVQKWTDSVNRHDPDAAAAYVSENCLFENVGTGMRLRGRAAFRDDVAQLVAMWTELHIDTVALFVIDSRYTKQWHPRLRRRTRRRQQDRRAFLMQVGILPPPTT
jgi:hypothetical protein